MTENARSRPSSTTRGRASTSSMRSSIHRVGELAPDRPDRPGRRDRRASRRGLRRVPLHHGLPEDARAVLEEGAHAGRRALGRRARERRRGGRALGRRRQRCPTGQLVRPLDRFALTAEYRASAAHLPGAAIRRGFNSCPPARSSPSIGARPPRAPTASGRDGAVLDDARCRRSASRSCAGRGFAEALAELLGAWRDDPAPRIACGMIGSRQGWIEAPYVALSGDRRRAGRGHRRHRRRRARDRPGRHHARRGRHARRDARRGDADRRRDRRRRRRRSSRCCPARTASGRASSTDASSTSRRS